HEFVRWQDSEGNIAGTSTTATLPSYASPISSVTAAAVTARSGDRLMVSLESIPAGAVFTYKIGSLNDVVYIDPFPMERSETLDIVAPAAFGTGSFVNWKDSAGTQVGTAPAVFGLTLLASGETETFTAQYSSPSLSYWINATADSGSIVSPSGKTPVVKGASLMVTFSARNGYMIYEVIVDGKPLSQDQIDLGYYTFRNVMMNHSIVVKSTDDFITLEVRIVEGNGHVDYSLSGRTVETYVVIIPMPAHTYLSLMAYADGGYEFKEWDMAGMTYRTSDISFNDVTSSIYIEVHFASDGGQDGFDWTLALIIILAILFILALAALLFFLLFYWRRYEVVEVEGVSMTERDKARRKRAYTFQMEGYSGTVAYRIGEDGIWKTLLPSPDGSYTIPGKDVVGKITIERR
ncbi:MAG: hypothetical protein FWG60_02680, partial [Methanomassiliicoccaceae archaeon]|nr:hypothetical protein [Methanomassiliicoccaceae archaeon]